MGGGGAATHFVISSHVDTHRQALLGLDSCTRCVQTELPNGDPHPIDPQVSKTQNSLSISHHHSLC